MSSDGSKIPAAESLRLACEGWNLFDLVAAMTAIMLLLHSEPVWYLRIPTEVFVVVGLLHRPLLRKAAFWLGYALLLGAAHARVWYSIDNHEYLMTYWVLGVGVALLTSAPLHTLARSARLLIGLCFAFATLWKLISPDFSDGTFFHFTFLNDYRFAGFTSSAGGLPSDVASQNARAIAELMWSGAHGASTVLEDTARIPSLARFLAWWTIAIEGSIALAFLLPETFRLSRVRDGMLMVFVVSTYPIATVNGFGWLLLVLGTAQSQQSASWIRYSYVGLFAVLPLCELPFVKLSQKLLALL